MEPVFPMPEPTPDIIPIGDEVGRYLDLLQENEARGRRLNQLLATVAQLKARTESVLAEQRADLEQLRVRLRESDFEARTAGQRLGCLYVVLVALVAVCESVCEEEGWTHVNGTFQQRIREAREVVASARPYVK